METVNMDQLYSSTDRRVVARHVGWMQGIEDNRRTQAGGVDVVDLLASGTGVALQTHTPTVVDESDEIYWLGPYHIARKYGAIASDDLPPWSGICSLTGVSMDTTNESSPRYPLVVQGQWIIKAVADVINSTGLTVDGFVSLCHRVVIGTTQQKGI